ncbi:MAG: alpha/beta fold hydrolase [Thermomicrobiales bacterium]
MTIESGVLTVNGARLAYDLAGDGPAVVLIHAGIADRRMWDDQFPAFAERFRVLRYDQRGFGDSDMPAGPFALHEDLRDLMHQVGMERAALAGVSMGGEVALNTALAYPGIVAALVVGATLAGSAERSNLLRQAWAETDEALEAGDLDRAVEVELRTWVDGPNRSPGDVDAAVRERVRVMDRALLAREMAGSEGEAVDFDPPAHERLGEIQKPTLLIIGDQDMPDVVESMGRLSSGIADATFVTLAGAAHMLSMEQPARFNTTVIDFLTKATS